MSIYVLQKQSFLFDSIEKFRTDLQIVFGMLQCRGNTENAIGYVNKEEVL